MVKKIIAYITVRRTVELLVLSLILSSIVILLNTKELVTSSKALTLFLLFAAGGFMCINIHMLRQCYFDLHSKFIYYVSNYAAFAIFAAVNILMCLYSDNEIYTWMFAITKFIKYTYSVISPLISAILFQIILAGTIALAPAGMNWIFIHDHED